MSGEIKRASEIWPDRQYENPRSAYAKYILVDCMDCGKERWVRLIKNKPVSDYCRSCGLKWNHAHIIGQDHSKWKGGRNKDSAGYIKVWVSPQSPFISMKPKTEPYILEHRLIMAEHLGRSLLPSEEVHHKNGVRDDNRIENLELISRANHNIYTTLCHDCELRKEIRLLRWQVKELSESLQEKLKI